MMGARRGLTDKARRHFSKGLDDLALAIAMTQHSRISLTLAAPSWSGVRRPEELTEFLIWSARVAATSAYGTKRTCSTRWRMSAFGGKADRD